MQYQVQVESADRLTETPRPVYEADTVNDEREPGWWWSDNELVDYWLPIIGSGPFSAYCILARMAGGSGKDKTCWPAYRKIAEVLKCSRRWAIHYCDVLEQHGLVVRQPRVNEKGGSSSNLFAIRSAKRAKTAAEREGGGELHFTRGVNSTSLGGVNSTSPKEDSCEEDPIEEVPPYSPPAGNDGPTGTSTRTAIKTPRKTAQAAEGQEQQWQEFLQAYPARSGDRGVKKGREKFQRILAGGVEPSALLEGARRYQAWCESTGKTGTEFVKQIPTWLNGACWQENWSIAPVDNGGTRAAALTPTGREVDDYGRPRATADDLAFMHLQYERQACIVQIYGSIMAYEKAGRPALPPPWGNAPVPK